MAPRLATACALLALLAAPAQGLRSQESAAEASSLEAVSLSQLHSKNASLKMAFIEDAVTTQVLSGINAQVMAELSGGEDQVSEQLMAAVKPVLKQVLQATTAGMRPVFKQECEALVKDIQNQLQSPGGDASLDDDEFFPSFVEEANKDGRFWETVKRGVAGALNFAAPLISRIVETLKPKLRLLGKKVAPYFQNELSKMMRFVCSKVGQDAVADSEGD